MTKNQDIYAVRQSYGRLMREGGIFDEFYDLFTKSSPEVAAKFANTDLKKQKDLLEHSISMALLFPQKNVIAEKAMARLRESHSREKLNIGPELYTLWLDCLIKAISKHDPDFTSELDRQWRKLMQISLDYIKEGY